MSASGGWKVVSADAGSRHHHQKKLLLATTFLFALVTAATATPRLRSISPVPNGTTFNDARAARLHRFLRPRPAALWEQRKGARADSAGGKCAQASSTEVSSNRIWMGTYEPVFHPAPHFIHLSITKQDGKSSSCSGVLISEFLVLTNAHCLEGAAPSNWDVIAGIGDFQSIESGEKRKVKAHRMHPQYFDPIARKRHDEFDLGIVELADKFVLRAGTIETVALPTSFSLAITALSELRECQIAGTGLTLHFPQRTTCEISDRKRYLGGIMVPVFCCNDAMRLAKPAAVEWAENTACFRAAGDMPCAGDSGAGVTCIPPGSDEPALMGLIRAGPRCCDPGTMNVLNDVIERNVILLDDVRRTWVQWMMMSRQTVGQLPPDLSLKPSGLALSAPAKKLEGAGASVPAGQTGNKFSVDPYL